MPFTLKPTAMQLRLSLCFLLILSAILSLLLMHTVTVPNVENYLFFAGITVAEKGMNATIQMAHAGKYDRLVPAGPDMRTVSSVRFYSKVET